MQGRTVVIGLLGALVVAVALVFWIGATGAGRGNDGPRDPRATNDGSRPAPNASAKTGVEAYDGGAIGRTIADRRVRDELRRRILAGWATGEGDTAEAARQGRIPPMPTDPSGGVDPAYIQSVVRADMMPMAGACYEELLGRQPDAGGRIEMFFKIVGDEKLGGIIEEVELDGGAPDAIRDEKMNTCVRESLLSVAFRPPPKDGWLTIIYPIVFSPGNGDD